MGDLVKKLERIQKSKNTNLAEKAYHEIKDNIIYCRFKSGEHLRENDLAEALGMSRTPVREALKKLANEDLVEIRRSSGVYVKNITIKSVKEIYEVRSALECKAAREAIKNLTKKEVKSQEEIWNSILDEVKNGEKVEWKEVARLDDELHSLLVNKCNNSRLISFMEIIRQQINRYQFLAALALDDIEITVNQHLEIIELLKNKNNEEKLVKVLNKHMKESAESIIENIF